MASHAAYRYVHRRYFRGGHFQRHSSLCRFQWTAGTIPSSQRFKADIKPMDNSSEAILAPVKFHYKGTKARNSV